MEALPRRKSLLRRIVARLWKHYMQAGVEGSARGAERLRQTEMQA
jgi:hypothetical protein